VEQHLNEALKGRLPKEFQTVFDIISMSGHNQRKALTGIVDNLNLNENQRGNVFIGMETDLQSNIEST
jgi:hypothetical protein